MVKDHVGRFAEVTREVKVSSGTIKVQSLKPEEEASIPQGDPARALLDVRMFRTQGTANTFEKVRHARQAVPQSRITVPRRRTLAPCA